ncbi:MAG TPA: VWA domain-containing protein [Candidatus Binataceae bacterium]|nr:VWA domain-containing protein [Candidatus Binataceae bacterium]
MIALFAILTGSHPAIAQQGQVQPGVPQPRNQGQGGGVLELPTIPGRQGGGPTNTIPPLAPQHGQELTLPSRQLKSQQGYQQVTVTVTDQSGRYVTGLQKGDFKLAIDGQDRPIEFFRQDLNTPVSIGILVDTSGSMQPKIPQAQAAISEFIRNLNDRDDIFMFAFSSRPFLLQPFTTNHYLVLSRLELLHAFGQTSLYDTILDGLLMVQHGRYDKRALLVVTDGMDNTSQSNVNQVVSQARRMGVLVYSIGIGDPNAANLPGLAIGPFIFGGDVDQVDARTLNTLSTESGAKTYIIREVGDGAALREACATISRELREQYTVGFVAPDASRGGYRSIHVDVPSHPEVAVRVRKGVHVGGAGTESADASPPG